jgi:hypothetical protein
LSACIYKNTEEKNTSRQNQILYTEKIEKEFLTASATRVIKHGRCKKLDINSPEVPGP